jgi:hypothetical protein
LRTQETNIVNRHIQEDEQDEDGNSDAYVLEVNLKRITAFYKYACYTRFISYSLSHQSEVLTSQANFIFGAPINKILFDLVDATILEHGTCTMFFTILLKGHPIR